MYAVRRSATMASNNTTLTSLWLEDGQGKGVSTPSTPSSSSQIPEDILKFYQDSGIDTLAREAGILDSNEEIAKATPVAPKSKTIKLIAVPVSSGMKTAFNVAQLSNPTRTVLLQSATPVAGTSTAKQTVLNVTQNGGVFRATPVVPKVIQLITTPSQNQAMQHQQTWTVAPAKRPMPPPDDVSEQFYSDSKRRKGTHGGKGLRHFSMKVCEKVQKKGVTSYNEVADELVAEFTDPRNADLMVGSDQSFDQKNIRRRVYDALNVLMAMNIISKEKKEIRWIGLPTNSAQECQNLEVEKQKILDKIQHKTQQLNELILQQIAFKNLVQRNRAEEQTKGSPSPNSAIQLPFILVNTSKKTVIDCSISNDKYEYLFNFDQMFEIHDDIEVLKRMGLAFGLEKGACSRADLTKAMKMVPKALEPYLIELAKGSSKMNSLPVSVKLEPGLNRQNPSYVYQSDQSLDAEVAWATGNPLSRQSSFGSHTDMQAVIRDSPDYDEVEDEDSDE